MAEAAHSSASSSEDDGSDTEGEVSDSESMAREHQSSRHARDHDKPEPLAWYNDARFQRFWDHYRDVNLWFRRHEAYVDTLKRCEGGEYAAWCQSQAEYHSYMADMMWRQCHRARSEPGVRPDQWSSAGGPLFQNLSPPFARDRPPRRKTRRAMMRSKRNRSGPPRHPRPCHASPLAVPPRPPNIEVQVSNFDPDNADLDLGPVSGSFELEMEVTDEMLDFFSQSAKHRRERDLKKTDESRVEQRNNDVYVELSEVSAGRNNATVLAPSERPGLRRIAEMRELYGVGAPMIHGMETAMQLSYDRICDRKQPRLWPALPINIKFN